MHFLGALADRPPRRYELLALKGGIRAIETRLEWLAWAEAERSASD